MCSYNLRLGETCSHVAAVLYKIETAIQVGLSGSTPTELPCEWNGTFMRNITGSPVADINFYTEKAKEKVSGQKLTSSKGPSFEQKKQFLYELKSVQPKTVCLHLFKEFGETFKCTKPIDTFNMLPSMREYFKPENNLLNETELQQVCIDTKEKIMQYDENSLAYIEEATLNQLYCDAWYQERASRITGPIIHQVYHTSVKNPSSSLIKKIRHINISKLNTQAVVWGRDHEELAIKIYTDVSSNKNSQFKSKCINDVVIHTDLDVKSFGLQLSPEKPWHAASPRQCDILMLQVWLFGSEMSFVIER